MTGRRLGYDVSPAADEIAPVRRAVDSALTKLLDWLVDRVAQHWLFLVNAGVGALAALPFVAPYLLSVGLTDVAQVIYLAYSYTCHQVPERSWFLFGYQMAFCQRDTATYVAMLLAGLVYGARGKLWRPLGLKGYLLLVAPLAVDGLTQAFGWRESTGLLRTVTGGLFGLANVWLAYPYLRRAVEGLDV